MTRAILTLAANCGINARHITAADLAKQVLAHMASSPFLDQHDMRLANALGIRYVEGKWQEMSK